MKVRKFHKIAIIGCNFFVSALQTYLCFTLGWNLLHFQTFFFALLFEIGCTQLRRLDSVYIAELLPRVIPPQWYKNELTEWNITDSTVQLHSSWLREVCEKNTTQRTILSNDRLMSVGIHQCNFYYSYGTTWENTFPTISHASLDYLYWHCLTKKTKRKLYHWCCHQLPLQGNIVQILIC